VCEVSEIWKALLEVQKEAPALQRDGLNPHFKSSYVTLETVMQTVLPILNRHGVVVLQGPHSLPETYGDVLVTKLVHAESGEVVESVMKLHPAKDDMQGYGSAMTYARRYAIMGMLGLVADADDDGNAASAPKQKAPAKKKPSDSVFPSTWAELEEAMKPYGTTVWDEFRSFGGQTRAALFPGEEALTEAQKQQLFDLALAAAQWLMVKFDVNSLPPPSREDSADAWAFALAQQK
jgi:hypothetical protein